MAKRAAGSKRNMARKDAPKATKRAAGSASKGVPRVEEKAAEFLGRLVRSVWIEWAKEQPNPKPSWLVPWEELPPEQQEVDRRIGLKVAEVVTGGRIGRDARTP